MPTSNALASWTDIANGVNAGQLLWQTTNPGLPALRCATWSEFCTYVQNTGSGAFSSGYLPTWGQMLAHATPHLSTAGVRFAAGAQRWTDTFQVVAGRAVDFWFRIAAVGVAGSMFSHVGPGDSGNNYGFVVSLVAASGQTSVRLSLIQGSAVVATVTTTNIGVGWHHCGINFNAGHNEVYIDGVLAGTNSFNTADDNASGHIVLNGDDQGLGSSIAVDYDEVRYWDIVRTQAQFQASMKTPANSGTAPSIHVWNLENDYTDNTAFTALPLTWNIIGTSSFIPDTAFSGWLTVG